MKLVLAMLFVLMNVTLAQDKNSKVGPMDTEVDKIPKIHKK